MSWRVVKNEPGCRGRQRVRKKLMSGLACGGQLVAGAGDSNFGTRGGLLSSASQSVQTSPSSSREDKRVTFSIHRGTDLRSSPTPCEARA